MNEIHGYFEQFLVKGCCWPSSSLKFSIIFQELLFAFFVKSETVCLFKRRFDWLYKFPVH